MPAAGTEVPKFGRLSESGRCAEPADRSSCNGQGIAPSVRKSSGSHQFKPAHGAGTGRELVGLDAQAPEHRHVQVGQRIVLFRVEGQQARVLEATAGFTGSAVGVETGGAGVRNRFLSSGSAAVERGCGARVGARAYGTVS